MAAAAAHELGTPLATISVVTKELLRGLPKDSPHAEDIALLRSQAERCQEILTTLTRQSGENDPMHASARLSVLLEEVVQPYRVLGPEISIKAQPARGSSGKATRREPVSPRNPAVLFGLGNLIENAVDFAKSRVQIDAMWDKNRIRLSIVDDGPGIQPNVLMRLGEPYVTSRAAGLNGDGANDEDFGLGLGFFIAKTLLERSGAEVELRNRHKPESGAIAQVTWPRDAMDIDITGAEA
jgi:two-component system sensor histidine kinase RegB